LLKHLIEEAYEAVEALSALPAEAPWGEPDYGAYAEVEDELGDLLLQVVFHATLARETGAFDVEEVAEGIRRKLVHRHPHVFGDVEVGDAAEVKANWEQIKSVEKRRDSLMDDIPASLPALARADKLQRRAATVGFDWDDAAPVLAKVEEEIAELRADLADPERRNAEFGDLLFAIVNLARHLHLDAEVSLRRAADRFADRFRAVEQQAAALGRDLRTMTLQEMDTLWDLAKAGGDGVAPSDA
jgi:MazG family protein